MTTGTGEHDAVSSSEDLKTIWEKHDILARRQNEHEKEIALTAQRVQLLETNMMRQMKECAEGNARLEAKIDGYAKDARDQASKQLRQQGVWELLRWVVPIAVAVAAIVYST